MSQLPGFRTDLVRHAIELTWDPREGTVLVSTRTFSRPITGDRWELESITVSNPLSVHGFADVAYKELAIAIEAIELDGDEEEAFS